MAAKWGDETCDCSNKEESHIERSNTYCTDANKSIQQSVVFSYGDVSIRKPHISSNLTDKILNIITAHLS